MSSDPHTEYKPLITSHCLVAAFEFVPMSFRKDEEEIYMHCDDGRSMPLPMCTARLRRAMLPNIVVQSRDALHHNTVDTFLHDDVRPSLPMSFCYYVAVRFDEGQGRALATVRRITATMPYLRTLIASESRPLSQEQQLELVGTLPPALWRLEVSWSRFSGAFIQKLSSRCQRLVRLCIVEVDSDAYDALFNAEENLFPCLRQLNARCSVIPTNQNSLERTYSSSVVRKLDVFSCTLGFTGGDFSAPSLKGLETVPHIDDLLSNAKLSSVPDFSVLNTCRTICGLLYFTTCCADAGPNAQRNAPVTIDLSGCQNIVKFGDNVLRNCTGVHSLKLPPSLESVGSYFCADATSLNDVDFAPCMHNLKRIKLDNFLYKTAICQFDTTFLFGKVGSVVGEYCWSNSKLVEIDLSGLQGVKRIETSFLRGARQLERVGGMDALSQVESIDDAFFAYTIRLKECDFSKLKSLLALPFPGALSISVLEGSALEKEGLGVLNAIVGRNKALVGEKKRERAAAACSTPSVVELVNQFIAQQQQQQQQKI